ncbi:MAG: addiction module protein [Planctomycetaceae bacterium]|nr:addiction module protein [Planctomycetaceae bacterium]
MSIELPLESMTLADKSEAMEASWADISRRPADLPSPDWHKDILYERRRHVAEGKLKFVDWDTTPMKPMPCTPATHRLLPILATSPGSPTDSTHSQSSDNSHQCSSLSRPSRHKISLSHSLIKTAG